MSKKNNVMVKVLAGLALLGIVISIVGTALLVLTSGGSSYTQESDQPTLTSEQLQDIIEAQQPELQITATGSAAE